MVQASPPEPHRLACGSSQFTCLDNYGTWEGEPGSQVFSYIIRSEGELTINGGKVYGSANGGISADSGNIIINDAVVDIHGSSSWHTLTISSANKGSITINGGTYYNTDTSNGSVFSIFNGMPSWQVNPNRADLEANGFFVNGGRFYEDGEEVICETCEVLISNSSYAKTAGLQSLNSRKLINMKAWNPLLFLH